MDFLYSTPGMITMAVLLLALIGLLVYMRMKPQE